MKENNSIVAIYKNHTDAESAIKELKKAGFDMKKLSIVGKEYQTDENVVGFYNTGDRMATWGKFGAFWGGVWGLVFGSAMFVVPGIGPIVIGGPLVTWVLAALQSAAIVGGLSAIGAGLYSFGIPKDSILKYETALKADKFLVIAHGTIQEIEKAKEIIDQSQAEAAELHKELAAQRS